LGVVRCHASQDAAAWLAGALPRRDASFERAAFFTAYAGVGRRFRGRPAVGDEATARLRAAGLVEPGVWSKSDLARAALLLAAMAATPEGTHVGLASEAFRRGDNDERIALLRVLPLLPGPERFRDVAVEADVERMIAEGVRRFGALHVLYNNAGVLWKDRDRSVLETDERWWDRVIAINLKSVFWVAKHGIPHLRRAGGGSIVIMGSVSALVGFTRAQDAYTAAKGGLISLTKSLAIQFAGDGIRCNVIHPGIVDTPLQAPYLTEELRREFQTGIPLGRIARPREIGFSRPSAPE